MPPVSGEFPRFFEQHARLPRGVDEPVDVSAWEAERLERVRSALPKSEGRAALAGQFAALVEGTAVVDPAPQEIEEGNADFDDDILEGLRAPNFIFEGAGSWEDGPIADATAAYKPWHFYGAGWGIDIYGDNFDLLVRDLHHSANKLRPKDNPYLSVHYVACRAFAAVVAHELFHFASEVAGTGLEALHRTSLVREHQLMRYDAPNPWTLGPLEELLATWAESEAELGEWRLAMAYQFLLDAAGRGYRDYGMARPPHQRDLMFRYLASDIRGGPVDAVTWPQLTQHDIDCVPIRWWGSQRFVGDLVRPREAPLEVTKFERYLRHHKIPIEAGGKHPHFRIGNRKCPYPTSKGSSKKVLPHSVLPSLSDALGFANPAQLRDAVRRKTVPPPALARAVL
jgi:hypothetical protein